MPVQTPVLVRNTEPGPTVLSDLKSKEYVEWAGSGDPMGGDVQPVPEDFLSNVNFMRAVQRGILVIENPEDNPEVVDAINKQNAHWRQRRENADNASKATLDHEANNDIVAVDCVGPAPRGDGHCPNTVNVRDKDKTDKPPLCSLHEDLAPQYVPTDDTNGERTVRKWVRVTTGARQRADQQ